MPLLYLYVGVFLNLLAYPFQHVFDAFTSLSLNQSSLKGLSVVVDQFRQIATG